MAILYADYALSNPDKLQITGVADLNPVSFLQGAKPSISCTTLKDSINGHLTVFRAEIARKKQKGIEID